MSREGVQPLRGIVVGLGAMGSNHLRVLSSIEGAELVGGVDPSPERRARAAAAHPRVSLWGSLADAVRSDQQVDFACVAVPVDRLVSTAMEALAAGLHTLVEKPLATTEDDARAVIHEAGVRGLVLSVGFVERFNPAVVALKRRLDEGAIGRPYQMHARRLSPFPNRESMHGVAIDLATHDVDVMRYLSGDEVMRVFAETDRRRHDRAEDLLCATLRFDGGATGLLEVNWLTPTKVRELSVTGEDGMFVVDYLRQELCHYAHPTKRTRWEALTPMTGGGEGDMIRYALERREPLRVEWEQFLTALRAGNKTPASGADGLAALSIARAIQLAGARGEPIAPAYRSISVA